MPAAIPSSSLLHPGPLEALVFAIAEAPTLRAALARLLKLAPHARFAGISRSGHAMRVLFHLGAYDHPLLAIDTQVNGTLRTATLLDERGDLETERMGRTAAA